MAKLKMDLNLALDGFALRVKQNADLSGIVGLMGPSGSGKTTLLRLIAGLERSATGLLSYDGQTWQDAGTWVPPHHRNIGYVFQDTRLFPHLNVAENLAYGLRWQSGAGQVPDSLIDVLELGPLLKRQVDRLSGGEKQRVALGRALAKQPALLLMDEPLSGLERARKNRILPYIHRAVALAGCPAIYVSHDQQEIDALCDDLLVLNNGNLQAADMHVMTLSGDVVAATKDQVTVKIGDGLTIAVPGQVRPGHTARLRISAASTVLIKGQLSAHTASVVLPGVISTVTPAQGGKIHLCIDVLGQQVTIKRDVEDVSKLALAAGDCVSMIPATVTAV